MTTMDTATAQKAIGFALGTLLVGSGIKALLDPAGLAASFGAPISSRPDGSDYVLVKGGRDIAFGASIAALVLRGQLSAAGVVMCSALVIGGVDTYVAWRRTGMSGGLTHLVGDGVFVAVGAWFLQS